MKAIRMSEQVLDWCSTVNLKNDDESSYVYPHIYVATVLQSFNCSHWAVNGEISRYFPIIRIKQKKNCYQEL